MHIRHNTRFPVWKINDHSKTDSERGGMLRYECFSASWSIIYVFSTWAYLVFPKNRKRKQRCKKIDAGKWKIKKNRGIVAYWYPSIHWSHAKRKHDCSGYSGMPQDSGKIKYFMSITAFYNCCFSLEGQKKRCSSHHGNRIGGVKSLSQLICILPLPVFWLSCNQLF